MVSRVRTDSAEREVVGERKDGRLMKLQLEQSCEKLSQIQKDKMDQILHENIGTANQLHTKKASLCRMPLRSLSPFRTAVCRTKFANQFDRGEFTATVLM